MLRLRNLLRRAPRPTANPLEQSTAMPTEITAEPPPPRVPSASTPPVAASKPAKELTAPVTPIPQGVFISYSHADEAFAQRLASDLSSRGVPLWIDMASLTPGLPDYERVIREAIPNSYALLLIATPASRDSTNVRGEVAKARDVGCPIIPIWAAGESWVDSAPLPLADAQYADCRDSKYANGLNSVLTVLRDIMDRRAPRHFRLELVNFKDYMSYGLEPEHENTIPAGYELVHVDHSDENDSILLPPGYLVIRISAGEYTAFRPSAYGSFMDLLHDLYVTWLEARFPPYTYGQTWVLRSGRDDDQWGHRYISQVLVPLEWMSPHAQQAERASLVMLSDPLSLKRLGIGTSTFWEVTGQLPAPTRVSAVATDDEQLARLLELISKVGQKAKSAKSVGFELERFLVDSPASRSAITRLTPDSVQTADFAYTFVLTDYDWSLGPSSGGKVIVYKASPQGS